MTVLFIRPVVSILAQARRSNSAKVQVKLLQGLLIQPLFSSTTGGVRSIHTAKSSSAKTTVCNMEEGGGNTPTVAAGVEARQDEKDYGSWDRESLVKRVKQLEEELKRRETSSSSSSKEQEKTKTPSTAASTAGTTNGNANGNSNGEKSKKERKAAGENSKKVFDPSRYETRMIALKLAYLGKNYGGFEYTQMTNVPTIEEELWKALVKSCLIFPENPDVIDFSPFEYAKCGRTDRGVSAFGQVINLRVRSQKKVDKRKKVLQSPEQDGSTATGEQQKGDVEMKDAPPAEPATKQVKESTWDPIHGEIPYCKVLNRLLPPDIRILAWAPNPPPNFSSRFSCRERQYRYFFTQPAFSPPPASLASPALNNGWLDIDAMRQAAKLFEGLHDFRNFCKVDPSKQITNYERRIFESDIVEVKDTGAALPYLTSAGYSPHPGVTDGGALPKVYYFHVRGSAFLWHQIRHMVGILFLVGQGLEKPSIVSELLDINANPRRPAYLMADEVPLVLWDCIFPKLDPSESGAAPRDREEDLHDPNAQINLDMKDDGIEWLWCGEQASSDLHGHTGLLNQSWEYWRAKKMDELLSAQLLNKIAGQVDVTRSSNSLEKSSNGKVGKGAVEPQKIFKGGNRGELLGPYKPVMKKDRLESPAEQHDKWARSKGFASAEEMKKIPGWHKLVRANKRKAADAGIEAETASSNGGEAASVAE
ncbi:pseudouridylate synthase [Naviculisporaceae sp. PSN 640]